MANPFEQAVTYFRETLGVSEAQARGIAGNLVGESNLDPYARGDFTLKGPTAFGIAQWHMPRVNAILKGTGIDVRDATFEEQLQAVAWEFQNTEKTALDKLLKTDTVASATEAVMRWFERPADASSLPARVEAAGGSLEDNSLGAKITNAITPDWITNLVNGHTAARWSSVIIGILFIGLAIATFTLKSDIVKEAL